MKLGENDLLVLSMTSTLKPTGMKLHRNKNSNGKTLYIKTTLI